MAAAMSGFVRFSCPILRAVFSLYPALRAAAAALRSTRYSRTNAACLGVSGTLALLPRGIGGGPAWGVAGPGCAPLAAGVHGALSECGVSQGRAWWSLPVLPRR